MDKENIFKAVQDQLEDIREQFEIIRQYEGKIPGIELDMMMENIRKLYETLRQIEKINRPPVPFNIEEKAVPPEKPDSPREEEAAEEEKERRRGEVAEGHPEPTTGSEGTPGSQEEKERRRGEVAEGHPEPMTGGEGTPGSQEEKQPEPKMAKTTLDLFGEHGSTLADRLKDDSEVRIADKLKPEKIDDIKNAIGINEKFLFINELFDGSLKNYEDAVGKLNDCNTSEQAGALLTELQATYKWDNEDPASKSFIELINRKF